MSTFRDLTGQRFGKLLVIERGENIIEPSGKKRSTWTCLCDCGNTKTVRGELLVSGKTTSCGCIVRTADGDSSVKNKNRLYTIWTGMKHRCEYTNAIDYHSYGGRGICVCEEWHDYKTFKTWALSNGYQDGLTIDRINVDGNYCPENCQWISSFEQQSNKQNNVFVEYKGETHTLAEWDRIKNFRVGLLCQRLNRGWTVERAIETPAKDNKKMIPFNGEVHSIREWEKIMGLGEGVVTYRLKKGWSVEDALTTPANRIKNKEDK